MSYGGGLNIFLRWGSKNNVFQISNSLFDSNTAVGGGGMGLAIRDTANNNKIIIDNCYFHYNNGSKYGGGGGGIKVSVYSINKINSLHNNTIIINKCNFIVFNNKDTLYIDISCIDYDKDHFDKEMYR